MKKKLEKFVKNKKQKKVIIYSLIGLVLLVGAITLYRTFALYEEKLEFNVLQGRVPEYTSGDVKIAAIIDGVSSSTIPSKNDGYTFESVTCDNGASARWDNDEWGLFVNNLSTSKTTCTLSFKKANFATDYLVNLANTSEDIVMIEHEATEQTPALTDYRYIGADPDNYVCLEDSGVCTDDQLYRIIGVIPTQASENGEYENRVKLIKATAYGTDTAWDTSTANDWTASTLKNTLNTTYWNSISSYQKYIDDTKWYLGGRDDYNVIASTFYTNERGTTVYSERPTSVIAKVGLMYPSDYGFAVGGSERSTCLAANLNTYNSNICMSNDWLFLSGSDQWFISPSSFNTYIAFIVLSNGDLNGSTVTNAYVVRPVFNLKSDVEILSGDGTKSSPWLLKAA